MNSPLVVLIPILEYFYNFLSKNNNIVMYLISIWYKKKFIQYPCKADNYNIVIICLKNIIIIKKS